jgi:hypothetical protein
MRRNHHFIYVNNWDTIPFKINNLHIQFDNIQYIKDMFSVNCKELFLKIDEIYNIHKHKYQLYDSIMIVKTTREIYSVSLHRAMKYPNDDVLKIISDNNIKFLEISQFKDIYEYICTIYHAKNIIFSYGGPMCTNRFFCNLNANVIVIGNLHYKPEYEYENQSKNYWHIRHAMLSPVKSQHFLLDFDNYFTIKNIHNIIQNIK